MKFIVLLFVLLFPLGILAQEIKGSVVDKETGRPVANATVSSSRLLTSTYSDGIFSLKGIYPGDTLTIKCIGYKNYKMGINLYTPKTITIYLQQTNIMLQSVAIKAKHNSKADSIRLRKQFSAVFDYKAPTFYDMFVKVDPYAYVPNNYILATNSTTTLVTIDVLSVISLLDKNKDHTSKLQKTLLNDEETTYVDRRFSKEKITGLTNLKGDSLLDFMDNYRPSVKQIKKMSDYDMVVYIKKSYADFMRNYDANERSPFSK
jgi:hypothetical protein